MKRSEVHPTKKGPLLVSDPTTVLDQVTMEVTRPNVKEVEELRTWWGVRGKIIGTGMDLYVQGEKSVLTNERVFNVRTLRYQTKVS